MPVRKVFQVKFDKETLVVVLICAAALVGWSVFYPRWQAQNAPAPQHQTQSAAPAASAPVSISPQTQSSSALPAGNSTDATAKPRVQTLDSRDTHYYFNSNGILDEVVLKNYFRTAPRDAAKDAPKQPIAVRESRDLEPFAVSIPGLSVKTVAMKKVSDGELVIARTCSGTVPLTITQTFSTDKASDVLKCRMEISTSEPTGVNLPQIVVWGGTLPPLKQLANDDLRDVHKVELCRADGGVTTVDPTAKDEKFQKAATSDPLEWVAVSNKYFVSLLAAKPAFNAGCKIVNPSKRDLNDSAVYRLPGAAGVYADINVYPGKPFVSEYRFYLGPKDLKVMTDLPASAANAVHLAYWSWLEPLCRPMLYLLNLLKDITGSYGLAIILLTVLVKLILWPLIHKGNKSMRRMQRLQPKLKELKEKYKDNQQEFSRQMMDLYRREKVSPFGGCFPMLLQLPVFIALYSTLDSSVELRHVSFLWAQDLSRPDLIGPTFMGIGLHPLILISTGLMVLQQKLSPPMADPSQQKIMMLMPVIMLVFFYSFPSGLALYWCVNNILSILQMKYSQYAAKKEELALNNTKPA